MVSCSSLVVMIGSGSRPRAARVSTLVPTAWVYLLTCAVVWGWTFVATKVALQYMTPLELLGWRFLIGLPFLLAITILKKHPFSLERRDKKAVLLGAAILTAHFLIQITGLRYTTATNTSWIISITPLVMALLAWVILKERFGGYTWLGIAMATLGILILVSYGDLTNLGWLSSVGDWLVLISAHTWALYTIVTRDTVQRHRPLIVTCAVLTPSATLVIGIMVCTSDWSRFLHLPTDGVIALLFLGLLGLAVGQWFWQEGVARIGAGRAGVFLYLEPLSTTILAVPYLGEPFGIYTALGGLLVLAGVYVAGRKPRRAQL